jgi:hypothetical protein
MLTEVAGYYYEVHLRGLQQLYRMKLTKADSADIAGNIMRWQISIPLISAFLT